MSKKKGDVVYDTIYGPFKGNPAGNRLSTIERMYIRILTELSANRFKWIGLPASVDERFLELTLFHQALCVFYFDTDYDRYLALRAAGIGPVNMYDNPTTFAITGNGRIKSKTLHAGSRTKSTIVAGEEVFTEYPPECVPIWGNFLRIPDKDIIWVYASKLAKVDRTIEINLDAMRYTSVITTTENQRLTWVNVMRQHSEGQPIIFGTEGLDMNNVQAFNVGVDKDVVLNLQLTKAKLWNECMTLLGINNSNQDKKERLVEAEVGANDEQVISNRGIALNSRRIAVSQINDLYKLSIDVGWNPETGAMAGQFAQLAGIPNG